MITAHQILEAYETSFTSGYSEEYCEIFVNPDSSDRRKLKKLGDEIRIIANPIQEKVWVWDAYLSLHEEVEDILGDDAHDDCILGILHLNGGRYTFGQGQSPWGDIENNKKSFRRIVGHDWSWTHRYGIYLDSGIEQAIKDEKQGRFNFAH